MSTPAIDLSRLPAPDVLETLDSEAILAASLRDLQARWPDYDTPLESDPAMKLLEAAAYREMLMQARINDAARSVMLAFSAGSDLDHLGANLNVARRLITPATDRTPAIWESDTEFRARIQLAPEMLPHAGITAGGYRFRALAAAPGVKDVAANKGDGGRVEIVLLGRNGDGSVGAETVATVRDAFTADDAVQLTDIVTVRAADIIPFDLTVHLQIGRGPDPAVIVGEARQAILAYVAQRHAIGRVLYRRGIEAAAKVGDVEQAIADIPDIDPGKAGAAFLGALTLTHEVL
ncbi:baseplate assembly protein [Altericroceibacterium endophyticum]|uniref:Baseplate assembly protein n=1 Tax=Altericroceibacterium endophyticum TaxID=1808508 RepID=A0A6I4T7M6_9SPHN|nr:baseplate J/gp47 family protein [Altericroceibacterium endophyticum]MXO66252.1 baseplate assembly protein [Altericroceibacterium endophyticum]